MIDFRKRLQDDDARRAFDRFEQRCGRFGEREHRVLPIVVEEVRDSGAGPDLFTVRGHGIVFDRLSLDLGGFQERIAPEALTDVLDSNPDVHLLWDHDTRLALARTSSTQYQLELRVTPRGVHYWARVAPTSYANDLRVLMEGGVVDQASFAFTVAPDGETWEIKNKDGRDVVIRTITKIDGLYDITITAQGAYPQTDSSVVRSYALAYAQDTGRLADEREAKSEDAAPTAPQVETPEAPEVDTDDAPAAPSQAGGDNHRNTVDAELLFRARQAVENHRFHLRKTNEST